ncbi:ribosome assembly factor SBDS [Candidatus Woesearchaeota archaeon]|nr:ribosome assembly factor SBDS [Candidatus Woesearchaeota archaeon]
MIDVSKAVIARLKKAGKTFEVLVDCDKAFALKAMLSKQSKQHDDINNVDVNELLAYEKVFTDSKKGVIAGEHILFDVFKTDNVLEIANIIIEHGELQLTAKLREQLREKKQKRIVELIHRKTVDPKTQLPHPVQRILLAMEEGKIRIDELKDEQLQLDEIIKKLQPLLPIKRKDKENE